LSSDASESSDHTSSDIATADTETATDTDDDGDWATCEEGLNSSDAESDHHDDVTSDYKSGGDCESELRRSCQNGRKESTRDYRARCRDENDESEYEFDQASDSDTGTGTSETPPSLRSITEDDLCRLIGLGALSGHQLAQIPYLRVIFMSRQQDEQVSMIRDVLDAGAMEGDRYQSDEGNLLQDLLQYLNEFVPSAEGIEKQDFEHNRADRYISKVLNIMASKHVTDLRRWHCFRKTLALRSTETCGRILLSESFDFSSDEWAKLRNDAKQATLACYSPDAIVDILLQNGFCT
jgi:hypothetical protein